MLGQALERAKRAAGISGGAVLVGLSGGKDSLATLDVVLRSGAFHRVETFSMYLVPGLECFEAPIRAFAERAQVPVRFVPHFDLSRMIRYAVLRPHVAGAEKLRMLKLKDVERSLTVELGIEWFAYGDRANDSYARRLYTRKNDGLNTDWHRFWPIWDWSIAQVFAYLKARKIPKPETFGETRTGAGSGLSLDAAVLMKMKKEFPRDYRKVLEVFPYAEAQVFRAERGDFDRVPNVPDGAGAPKRPQKRAVQPAHHQRSEQAEAPEETEAAGPARAADLE